MSVRRFNPGDRVKQIHRSEFEEFNVDRTRIYTVIEGKWSNADPRTIHLAGVPEDLGFAAWRFMKVEEDKMNDPDYEAYFV